MAGAARRGRPRAPARRVGGGLLARPRAPPARARSGSRRRTRGTGCWPGWAKCAAEAAEQDRGAALGDREGVAPEPQREREAEERREQRVRPLAREVRGQARDPDHDRVELAASRSAERSSIPRRSASACATDGGPANAVAADSSTGSDRSTSWRSRRGEEAEERPQRRAGDPLERLGLVRIAASVPPSRGWFEDERDADHRHAARRARARARPPSAQPVEPAVSSSEAAPAPAQRLRVRGAEQRGRAAVEHGLGGGDRDDEVGLDAGAGARAAASPRPPPSSIRSGASRRAPRRGRGSGARTPARRASADPAATAAAGARPRRASSGSRTGSRAARARRPWPRSRRGAGPAAPRDRERGRLDHDRRAAAARTSASSGSPESGKRNASRTAAATSAIACPGAGGRRISALVGRVHDRQARAGEERDARHAAKSTTRLGWAMSPKTLTGAELELDDAPARGAELFLVDGNNLAYRALLRPPGGARDLATASRRTRCSASRTCSSSCSPTTGRRASRSPGTRGPSHRAELHEGYKEGRRPMPDLLREQFPHFRPIVEAFGYANLEFEGWEADDVIATLATRADEAGVKTCVVSTDRDAFQLCSENVSLMMTPRGVSDVQVYTPERVEARYGVRPDQVPDFIGLKGDTSDNIPGVPGIGDKTAGQLIAQYGSLEAVLEHVDELSPARAKALREHAEQARTSKELATMRRDLELDVDPAALVLAPPDRSELRELFRRFEFRGLLNRIDDLDVARARRGAGARRRHRGRLARGRAARGARPGRARGRRRPLRARRRERRRGRPVGAVARRQARRAPRWSRTTRRRSALPFAPADDTMIAAYLIEPGRAAYELDDLAAEYGVEAVPDARGRGGDRRARPPRRGAAPPGGADARAARRARLDRAVRGDRAAARRACSPRWRTPGSRSTPTGWARSRRASPRTSRSSSRARTSSRARSSCSARRSRSRGSCSRSSQLTPGRKGKTGYSTDTRVLRTIRARAPDRRR